MLIFGIPTLQICNGYRLDLKDSALYYVGSRLSQRWQSDGVVRSSKRGFAAW